MSFFGGASTPSTGGLLGSAPPTGTSTPGSLFGSAASKPAGGLFGSPAPAAATNTSGTTAPSTGLFGTPAASSTPAGGIFGNKPAATGGSLFGNAASTTTPSKPTLTFGAGLGSTSTTTQPAAGTGGGSIFGNTGTTTTPAAKPALTFGSGLGGVSTTQTTTGNVLPTIGAKAGSGMTFTELNNILNRLVTQCVDYNEEFIQDIAFLNQYDKVLRDNQRKLEATDNELTDLENEKTRCIEDSELIAAQVNEVNGLLTKLEKSLGLPESLTETPKAADSKRQHLIDVYHLAAVQTSQLEEEVDNLNHQVDALVSLTETDENSTDTFDELQQILATQLSRLVAVDQQTQELDQRIADLKKRL